MPRLTDEQVNEAIEQMTSFAGQKHEVFKQGVGEYEFLSARGVLHDLGYDGDAADRVLENLHTRGFTHCLDPMFQWEDPDTHETSRPSADACHWGADQLHSRLRALR